MKSLFLTLFIFFSLQLLADSTLTPQIPSLQSFDPDRYEQYMNSKYSLFMHERNYILPFSYVTNPSEDIYPKAKALEPNNSNDYYSNVEAEFQISFFFPVSRKMSLFGSNWDFLFSYTHHAWWQIYNAAWSRPFRETNYTPEVFIRQINEDSAHNFLGLKPVGYDLGYVHESNGQIQLLSRSWNRLFARAYLAAPDFLVTLTGWLRLPESESDDNADIQVYKGVGSLEIQKAFGSHTLELEMLLAQKSGLELRYSYPFKEGLRWFLDVKYGYGQSLIEYDRVTKRIALGFALENFLDQK